jgi:DNA-binding protein H-NS
MTAYLVSPCKQECYVVYEHHPNTETTLELVHMATTKKPSRSAAKKAAPNREPSPVNIDHLNLKQLETLDQRIAEAIQKRRESTREEVKATIMATVQNAGLTLEEVFGGKRRGAKAAVKFRDPENAANTWTGRGRQPRWLVAKLSGNPGAKLADFSVAA